MCRRNGICGCMLLTFGIGLICGSFFSSRVLCCLIGTAALCVGFLLVRRI